MTSYQMSIYLRDTTLETGDCAGDHLRNPFLINVIKYLKNILLGLAKKWTLLYMGGLQNMKIIRILHKLINCRTKRYICIKHFANITTNLPITKHIYRET
jgi:hypothetical protein